MQSRFGLLNMPMRNSPQGMQNFNFQTPAFNNMRANYAQNFQNMGMQPRPQFQPIANNMNIPRTSYQDTGWAGFGQVAPERLTPQQIIQNAGGNFGKMLQSLPQFVEALRG